MLKLAARWLQKGMLEIRFDCGDNISAWNTLETHTCARNHHRRLLA